MQACKNQMQQAVQDLARQLEELELQHEELTSRTRVLDLMLKTKQAQCQILQEGLQTKVKQPSPAVRRTQERDCPCCSIQSTYMLIKQPIAELLQL